MDAYYDTGILVALYVQEIFSSTINTFIGSRGKPIALNSLQQLEFENAVRLKGFRKDLDGKRLNLVFRDLKDDVNCGRLVLRLTNWVETFNSARSISRRTTAATGCRTLDFLHVAIAIQWDCSLFVSTDDRQLGAARDAGLETVDIRDMHRRQPD